MITWNPNVKYTFVTGTYLDNKSKRQCQRWGIVLSVSLFMWSPTVGMRIFQMEGDARLQWFTPLFPQTDLFAGAAAKFKTKWQCGLYRLYCTVSLLDIITPCVFPSSIFSWPHCFALLLWLPALLNNKIRLFICHGNTLQIGSIPLATLLNMVLLKQHWITGSFQPSCDLYPSYDSVGMFSTEPWIDGLLATL